MSLIGYEGMGDNFGIFVSIDQAFDYAMQQMPFEDEEAKEQFVDWFFSGNWVKVREGDRKYD
jgi:hypothetical protein